MNAWTKEDDESLVKAEEVNKLVSKLCLQDDNNYDKAMHEADTFLKKQEDTKDKFNHTSINQNACSSQSANASAVEQSECNGASMDQAAFMASIEADARRRAERKAANRKRAENWKQRGNEYFRAADYQEAKRCYSEAKDLCRDWDIIYTNLAMTCNKLGEYEETLKHCEWAERLNENNVKSMLHRGKALVGLKRPQEALKVYEAVLEIEPKKKTFMREYIAEAEAANEAMIEEEKATALFEETVSNQNRNEDPERLVLRLICEVARPGHDSIFYSGGLRLLARSITESLSTSQTLFRARGGFTLLERPDTVIGKILSKPVPDETKSDNDVLLAIIELGTVVCEDCEENQRRMMAVPGLSSRLVECIKLSTKSARDPLLISALRFLFMVSQSDSGRKAVNDWLDPVVILPKLVQCVQHGSAEGAGQHAASLLNNMALSPRFQTELLSNGNVQITEAVESLLKDGGGQSVICISSCLNCVMNLCANMTIRRRLSCRLSFLNACTTALERYLPLHADEKHTKLIQALLGLLINVTTGVDKTSGAIRSVSPRIVNACSKVLAVGHALVHRDRLFTLLSTCLPVCAQDFVEAWCVNKEEGSPILVMVRRIICHETGEHPAAPVAVRVLAAATLHHTETRYGTGDDEELVTRLASFVLSSNNEVLAGNAALCLGHCVEDTCLAEHLTKTDIILGLLRRCSNSERSEAQTNYGLLIAKLAQANPRHRERVTELKGFEVIHAATRSLRTC